ncbi:site-specific integrase [Microbacterium trichothecenolyticum]|uniref:Transposase n=1 Tax=Microbacterium trichothecenolyticum TaxID=69370 RepID=A0A0M2HEC6_MICTR|nr:site-specific integrase [Microbacterium trichothecenolyticum]KJL44994.1 Transposase [Microbacterium trichothecenolyticum]
MGSVESYDTAKGRRYRVRYRTPNNRQTDKRGFRTKRDAEEFLAGVETLKATGEFVSSTHSRILVRDWAQVWLSSLVNLKPTTRSGYEYTLGKHILPRWGSHRLGDISHAQVQHWVSELSQQLAASTVRQVYHVLASMLKFAVRDRKLTRNPAEDIKLPRITKRRRGYLTHEQVAVLVEAAADWGDLLATLAYTGLRWGELAALRVKNVDLAHRRLSIVESVSEIGGTLAWGTPKSDESRVVVAPSFLVAPLKRRMTGKRGDDLVFTTLTGTPMRNNNFRHRVFNPALAKVREQDPLFPVVTPHDLRHTAASLAVSAGANVKAVQRMLGHASAAMTLDVYADLFDEDLNAVSDALDREAAAHFAGKVWPEPDLGPLH